MPSIYEKYRLKQVINTSGRMTALGVSTPRPEVVQAAMDGMNHYFEMKDLVNKTGEYIAKLLDVAAEIEWAKVSMLTPDTYVQAAEKRDMPAGWDARTMQRLYQSYEDLKADRHLIDFEDVLLITVGILEEDERIAAAVHAQYRHFVVDEYQDVNALQQRLLDLWVGNRDSVCVVGDVSQTIYSFTGATPRYLTSFTERYPAAPVVRLVRDYRSTPQVVSLANRVLTTRSGRMARGAVELVAQRPSSVTR